MTASDAKSSAVIRHMGGQTVVVMGGTAFTLLVGLPFQIYLARSLGTAGLGTVGIAEALVQTAAGFLTFGLAPLAVRYIPEYRVRGASQAIRLLLLTGLIVLVGLGLLGAIFLAPLAWLLPGIVGLTIETVAVLEVLGWLLPLSMLSFFLTQSLRGFQEIWIVVLANSILALTFKLVFTLGLFATVGISSLNYAWAMVLSQTAVIPVMGWALWRLVRALPSEADPSPVNWKAWASYAATNYASGLTSNLTGNVDRIVVGSLLGPSAVGILMTVRQLMQFPTVFHQMVLTVIAPVFARLKATGDTSGLAHQLHLANDWIFRLAAGLILVLAIQSDHILALYGPEFSNQGRSLMLAMTLAVLVNIGTGPVGILLNMTGYHLALLRIQVLTSLLVFAGYFALVPAFGLVGVGLAILLANIINNGVAIWFVHSQLNIQWYDPRFSSWLLPVVATALLVLGLRSFVPEFEPISLQATALVGITLLAYTTFFSVNLLAGLHEDDREMIAVVREQFAKIG